MTDPSFDEYQDRAGETAIYPGSGGTTGLMYTALGLAGEAGEAANKVKKVLRDNEGKLTEESAKEIGKEIGGVLWYAAMLADEVGLSLGDIARQNLDILAGRAARGVLSGSGDNR